MSWLLAVLFPVLEHLAGRSYDVGFPPVFIAIGLIVILAVGAAIVGIIVLAVKLLGRIGKHRGDDLRNDDEWKKYD